MEDKDRKRYFVIINPGARGGHAKRLVLPMLKELEALGITMEIQWTKVSHDAYKLAYEAYRNGYRHFIIGGGDGTAFEILNGIFQGNDFSERVTFCYLPIGTGNSFIKDFNVESKKFNAEAIKQNRRWSCDVIKLTHQDGCLYYLNMLSFGFVAEVAHLRNTSFNYLGNLGYIVSVLVKLLKLRAYSYELTFNNIKKEFPAAFIAFCNSRYAGGCMMMAPNARIDDGLVDYMCLQPVSRWKLLRSFPSVFSGKHIYLPEVTTAQINTVEFNCAEPINSVIDGEIIQLRPIKLEVLPNAIDICA